MSDTKKSGSGFLGFTSTAESVAMIRLVLSDEGILDESMTEMFCGVKAFIMVKCLNFLLKKAGIPGGFSHLATRTKFYDGHIKNLVGSGPAAGDDRTELMVLETTDC